MNCPVCQTSMVKARATAHGEEYDYCRTCKKELKEMQVVAEPEYKLTENNPYAPDFTMVSYYLDPDGSWKQHDSSNPPPSTL